MRRARGVLAGAAALLLVSPGAAWEAADRVPGAGLLRGGTGLAAQGQEDLAQAAGPIARAWASGADQVVAARFVEGRVRLYLDGTVSATLPTRQASAALREFLRGYDGGQVEVARVSLVDGSGERGFAELRWTARRSGTSQPLRRTVFLGFRHDGGSWSIEEVRVMH